MHSTSPGREQQQDNDAVAIMDDLLLIRQNLMAKSGGNDDEDDGEKIYDDPYELMMTDDWTSPVHIPRSRSWLCCPNGIGGGSAATAAPETATTTMTTSVKSATTRPNCEYTSLLVTEQPKAKTDPVNFHYFFFHNLFDQRKTLPLKLRFDIIFIYIYKMQLKLINFFIVASGRFVCTENGSVRVVGTSAEFRT